MLEDLIADMEVRELREAIQKNRLIVKEKPLRDYQNDAIYEIDKTIKLNILQILLMVATGGGKTRIASDIIRQNVILNKDFKAMFICDRIELINQTSRTFFEDGLDHGVIQSYHELEDLSKNIQVCSIQTLARRTYNKPDMIFIDEAHTLYEEHKKIIEQWQDIPIIGLTATPFTKSLGIYFKKLIVGANPKSLIQLGYLVKPTVFAPSKPDLENIKTTKGDYDNKELEYATNTPKLVGDIIEHWLKLAKNKPTICFSVNINHSKNIKEAFKEVGVICEHLDAYTDEEERKEIIRKFRKGEIKVLTSVDILSKGFDYPGAEVAILARPTKSLSLYIQQVGRVLRISPETGKKGALILDHSGNTETHGFVDDDIVYSLDMSKKSEKQEKIIKVLKEKVQTVCYQCSFVKDTLKCPNCGCEKLPENKILSFDGYLVEKERVDGKIKVKMTVKEKLSQDKHSLYGQLKKYYYDKGQKVGKAYYMYKDIVGDFPTDDISRCSFVEVSTEVTSYIKYIAIRNAKSGFKYR